MADAPEVRPYRCHWVTLTVRAILFVVVLPVGALSAAPPDPLAGRYVVAESSVESGDPAGQTVDIARRNRGYSVVWRTGGTIGAKGRARGGSTRRGLAFREGNLLGVSLATGGPAHGVGIYKSEDGGRRWRGRWVTSIDGASAPGEIVFDTPGNGGALLGRHPLHGRRDGGGSFEGAVTITKRAGAGETDYALSFSVGGVTVYRGLGQRFGGRLVVGWSFGSAPSLAVYEIGADGKLDGRRLTTRTAEAATTEQLAPFAGEGTGADGLLLLPAPAALEEPGEAVP